MESVRWKVPHGVADGVPLRERIYWFTFGSNIWKAEKARELTVERFANKYSPRLVGLLWDSRNLDPIVVTIISPEGRYKHYFYDAMIMAMQRRDGEGNQPDIETFTISYESVSVEVA